MNETQELILDNTSGVSDVPICTSDVVEHMVTDAYTPDASIITGQNGMVNGRPNVYSYRKTHPVVREHAKVHRNDPCPCGSGRKYKDCCLSTGVYEGTMEREM